MIILLYFLGKKKVKYFFGLLFLERLKETLRKESAYFGEELKITF